jgi:hypothetical protein
VEGIIPLMHTEETTLRALESALLLVEIARTHNLDGEDELRLASYRGYVKARRDQLAAPNRFVVDPQTMAPEHVSGFVEKLNESVQHIPGGVSLVVSAKLSPIPRLAAGIGLDFDIVTHWYDGRLMYNFTYTISGMYLEQVKDDLSWYRHIVHAIFNELFVRPLTNGCNPG